MNSREIRIFGDSHCATLTRVWQTSRNEPPFNRISSINMLAAATAFYEPFFRVEDGRIQLTAPLFEGRMAGLCDQNGFLIENGSDLLISLGFHTNTFLNSKLFHQHMPYFCAPEKRHPFISTAAIASIVTHYHHDVLDFFDVLIKRGQSLTVLSAPPPTRRFGLLPRGFSPVSVIRLDRLVRETMMSEFARRNIPVILPPEKTKDADGFLLEQYLIEDERDPHHGNMNYSREFLLKILREYDQGNQLTVAMR